MVQHYKQATNYGTTNNKILISNTTKQNNKKYSYKYTNAVSHSTAQGNPVTKIIWQNRCIPARNLSHTYNCIWLSKKECAYP